MVARTEPRAPAGIADTHRPLGVVSGLFGAAWAFMQHDLAEKATYPLTLLNQGLSLATVFALFYFGGGLLNRTDELDLPSNYFVYSLTGYAGLRIMQSLLSGFGGRVRRYQMTGMMEACVMTRTPFWQVLLAMPAWDMLWSVLSGVALVAIAIGMTGASVLSGGVGPALVSLALGAAAAMALGIVLASITMVVKYGDPLSRLIGIGNVLAAGAFVPVEALPNWLATAGSWLPLTQMLAGVRDALFAGGGWSAASDELARLAILTGCLIPLAAIALHVAMKRVLRDGSMAHY